MTLPSAPPEDGPAPKPFADILACEDTSPFTNVFEFEDETGAVHPVLWAGEGPGIILMHELPGFVPEFWRLAHWLRLAGFRVYAPALYEYPGTPLEEIHRSNGRSGGMGRACVSREIHLFSKTGGSPISNWLRALARKVYQDHGGKPVGAIGLCLSGNFAWSVAVDPVVKAAVAAEPALPFNNAASIHIEPEEAEALKSRENLSVLALRFDGDPSCKAARFAALESVLGDRLETRVLPDEAKNPKGNPFPHAVLTKDLIAEDGQPTFEAAREVLGFFTERLNT